MANKVVDADGVVQVHRPCNTFAVFKTFEGQKDFDEYYIDVTLKKVAVKVGPGEDDFVIKDKEIISKRSIKEVINAQNGDAGIEAYLKPFIMSGESLPAVQVKEDVQDFTNCPDNLADAIALGEDAKKAFSGLDPKLTKGMSYEEFITSITREKYEEYLRTLFPQKEEKKEGV